MREREREREREKERERKRDSHWIIIQWDCDLAARRWDKGKGTGDAYISTGIFRKEKS